MSLQGLGIRDWRFAKGCVSCVCIAFRPITLALIAPIAPIAPTPYCAQPPTPELTRPVNDFANVISPEREAEIERRILALKKARQSRGDVVVVATIDTFAPYADIREYAVRMFENRGRGIGEKGKDNGVLVLLAVKDRRVWVEVGYDLEQFVTDGFAGEVSRNAMTPYFARGDYGGGAAGRRHAHHRPDRAGTRRHADRRAAVTAPERIAGSRGARGSSSRSSS